MKLSVVILNYNVRYFLELCLKSVQAAIKNIDAEIIVVDNNSEDNSCSMVKSLFPDVKLIENNENFGFSKGNNIGVNQAKGEYVCVLNPDTVVPENVFLKLLDFAENTKNLGAIGCKLINGIGVFLPESKRNVPLVKVAYKKMIGNAKQYYANHLNENDIGKVPVLVGAFMFLKRSVYYTIGGFDEDYFMYGEDIDLSYKLTNAGYNNYYYGKVSVIHFKGESTLKDKLYAKRFYDAMQIFYQKHFKQNIMFDTFVWLGVKIAYVLRGTPKITQKKVNRYVLFSGGNHAKLSDVLNKKIVLKTGMTQFQKADEIVLDANHLSYQEIIATMEAYNNQSLTFKILPEKSDFILGSDSPLCRGEVIQF
ncbi:glycosyltransferase family 2 protein [Seonamhaeicola algicola]|uniref:Glycosyltransferase family 2 protein n=1 Tax=Seonamhaeicola algicola TaxID=1719036 RepID=A0A5C7ATR2_9FLAO|nr:glycosyltransferase family 2 protein [Seonamhaeicola algicola]TXE12068.1 glycosyltransferase family 2 protein [Seonamhaeicola algicola]